ncbi:hypothetical protein AVEN_211737-1 [Araneus ventricosus]|uniref:Uncharacterized protein n=1 Tax=Araneus ventricosus TaxID=182803 RepID=A0A4Y2TSF3_ARAVE|nr:hypothetical protein AVEN_211737-1 [Araneus ventricosus]
MVRRTLHLMQTGGDSPNNKYLCARRECPMRSRVKIASYFRFKDEVHCVTIVTDVEARLAQNKKTMKEQISTHRPPKRRRENDVSEDEDSEEDEPQR